MQKIKSPRYQLMIVRLKKYNPDPPEKVFFNDFIREDRLIEVVERELNNIPKVERKGIAVYLSINSIDEEKALYNLNKVVNDNLYRIRYNNEYPKSLRQLNKDAYIKSFKGEYCLIDFDSMNENELNKFCDLLETWRPLFQGFRTTKRELFIDDLFIKQTRGGYHIIINRDLLGDNLIKSIKDYSQTVDFELKIDFNNNALSPMLGQYQAEHKVMLI